MCDLDPTRRRQAADKTSAPSAMPAFSMPAMPPLRLIGALERWFQAWVRRRRLLRLLDYDDHLLEDMGHTRRDLLWASRLPLRINAHRALRRCRERQRPRRGAAARHEG